MPCAPASSTCLTIQMFWPSSRPVAEIRTMTALPAITSSVTATAEQDGAVLVNQRAGDVPELASRQIHMLATTRELPAEGSAARRCCARLKSFAENALANRFYVCEAHGWRDTAPGPEPDTGIERILFTKGSPKRLSAVCKRIRMSHR